MKKIFKYIGKEFIFAKISNQNKAYKIKELPCMKEKAGGMDESEQTTGF